MFVFLFICLMMGILSVISGRKNIQESTGFAAIMVFLMLFFLWPAIIFWCIIDCAKVIMGSGNIFELMNLVEDYKKNRW